MAVSKSQQAAVNRYVKKNYARLSFTIQKAAKDPLEVAAKANNESVNGYIKRAVMAQYEAETGSTIKL